METRESNNHGCQVHLGACSNILACKPWLYLYPEVELLSLSSQRDFGVGSLIQARRPHNLKRRSPKGFKAS